MKRIIGTILTLVTLSFLLAPSVVSAATGIEVVSRSGDGVWTDDTWQVQMFPGGGKATTLRLYNSSSSSLAVEVTVSPSSLDNGNLTFELDKSSFTMPGKSSADVTLNARASGSTTPGTYTTELEIKSELPPPAGGGGGGGGGQFLSDTNYCGALGKFWIDSTGKVIYTFTAGCLGGPLTTTVNKGTIALGADGKPLKLLSIEEDVDPPDPPGGTNIITIPYALGPAGATFDPPLTFTWTYDPDELPEGVDEGSLVIAFYDGEKWVELDCVVDTEEKTITAEVSHFTTFAALAPIPEVEEEPAVFSLSNLTIQPAEVQPEEAVTISVYVANTGGSEGSYTVLLNINGAVETSKEVMVNAGFSKEVTFTTTRDMLGTYTVTVDGLSGSFTVAPAIPVVPVPGGFLVTNLSITPLEVQPKETVTITVSVTNTFDTWGIYSLVLNINGVKEAETQAELDAGSTKDITFSVMREDPGTYTVFINGLSGSFTVIGPAKPIVRWPLIGGIIATVVVIVVTLFLLVRRRRSS